ncbi:hypothetical protein L2K20_06035 [Mycobacterium sp. MBM]|nr:hypothetical protein [Mycobacterium sp. MBM]
MNRLPQHDHADLGLIDDDRTEDLRPNSRTAPEPQVRQHLAGTAANHPPSNEQEF